MKRTALIAMSLALGLIAPISLASPAHAAPPSFSPVNLGDTLLYGGCRPYVLIGMRGSGEPLTNVQYGLGSDLHELWDTMNANGSRFRDKLSSAVPTASSYPARPVPISTDQKRLLSLMDPYLQQVYNGSGTALQLTMVQVASRCPTSKLIVAGYSQGAYAVNFAMRRSSSTVLSKVAGTILLADPAQNPAGALRILKSYCSTGNRPANITTASWNELRTVSTSSNICVRTRAATIYTAPTTNSFRYFDSRDVVADFGRITSVYGGFLLHTNYESSGFSIKASRWAQTGVK
jgi:hypothetical protein